MNKSIFTKVKETYQHLGVPISDKPILPNKNDYDFRVRFIFEELNELDTANDLDDIVGMADALADLVIVIYGLAATMGLPFDEILTAVNTSNYNGRKLVETYEESKRGYEYDLIKTEKFIEPKDIINVLLKRLR